MSDSNFTGSVGTRSSASCVVVDRKKVVSASAGFSATPPSKRTVTRF